MGKESITLSMELAKTQSHEFECFEDNYSLTISMQGCRINMCFPGRDTYFQGLGTYIKRHTCSPDKGTHITRNMGFMNRGTHITRDMCFPGRGTHLTRDMCFPGRKNISQGICVS